MKYFGIFIILSAILIIGCESNPVDNHQLEKVNMNSLEISDNFDFKSTEIIDIRLGVFLPVNRPVEGIVFSIYNDLPEEGGSKLSTCITGADGLYEGQLKLPSYQESIVVIGYMSTLTLPFTGNQIEYIFGGQQNGRLDDYNYPRGRDGFTYLDPYNSDGVPDSLEYDEISDEFLVRVNVSLPERYPVPQYHPDYLDAAAVNNVLINEECDVWLTFVHEGAGYRNSLGFYVYDQGEAPPQTLDSLTHIIAFPNASLRYSGGDLEAGDKVYLGRFPGGKVLGWFLVANGWNGSSVSETASRWYSNPEYNTSENPDFTQHTILLYDEEEEKLLLGVEDLRRSSGADDDFNDAVFYCTANPPEAIDTQQVNPIDEPGDVDGDGVSNVYDDYPEDPDRAFDTFYPSQDNYGTLAFEDLWPQQGDYDLNDLVANYNFKHVLNSDLDLIELQGEIRVRAIGGSNQNGFGIEFPFSYDLVTSHEGSWQGSSFPMELFNSNGKAALEILENTNQIIQVPGNGVFINTQPEYGYTDLEVLNFKIVLSQPLQIENLIFQPPYNPYISVNQQEGREVHLPDYPPTSEADPAYFQTEDDDTNISIGRYYRTDSNLPWAIDIPESWNYPVERSEITWAYLAFPNWAESDGINHTDWYKLILDQIDQEYIFLLGE